jgi:hypothetical protein
MQHIRLGLRFETKNLQSYERDMIELDQSLGYFLLIYPLSLLSKYIWEPMSGSQYAISQIH